jgi:hypothetical protein
MQVMAAFSLVIFWPAFSVQLLFRASYLFLHQWCGTNCQLA